MRLFVRSETTKIIYKNNEGERNIYYKKSVIKMQNLIFKFKSQILHFKIDLNNIMQVVLLIFKISHN